MKITFDNYLLRDITIEDANAYFDLVDRNRPRLEDFFAGTVAKTKTPEATAEFIQDNLNMVEAKKYFSYVIVASDTNQLIGYLDVKSIDWKIPKAELGCFMDEDFAGKGISSLAVREVSDYLFQNMGFDKLYLRTHKTNISAQKVAEKAGFIIEGTIRKDYKTTKGELVDLLYYGRIKEE